VTQSTFRPRIVRDRVYSQPSFQQAHPKPPCCRPHLSVFMFQQAHPKPPCCRPHSSVFMFRATRSNANHAKMEIQDRKIMFSKSSFSRGSRQCCIVHSVIRVLPVTTGIGDVESEPRLLSSSPNVQPGEGIGQAPLRSPAPRILDETIAAHRTMHAESLRHCWQLFEVGRGWRRASRMT
jgi:hypothetical protein